jgi:hypothetical protein
MRTKRRTHIGRGIRDRDRRLERIRLAAIIIPQLAKRRQPTKEAQRRIGSERRSLAVAGDGEDVFFATCAEGLDRLGGDAVNVRAGSEGELERGEHAGVGERGRIIGTATDDEAAKLVVLEVVLRLLDGVVEIRRRALDGDVKVEARRNYERGGAGAERGGDGPQRKGAGEEREGEQQTQGHNSPSMTHNCSFMRAGEVMSSESSSTLIPNFIPIVLLSPHSRTRIEQNLYRSELGRVP